MKSSRKLWNYKILDSASFIWMSSQMSLLSKRWTKPQWLRQLTKTKESLHSTAPASILTLHFWKHSYWQSQTCRRWTRIIRKQSTMQQSAQGLSLSRYWWRRKMSIFWILTKWSKTAFIWLPWVEGLQMLKLFLIKNLRCWQSKMGNEWQPLVMLASMVILIPLRFSWNSSIKKFWKQKNRTGPIRLKS